jgi:hypothetical protein
MRRRELVLRQLSICSAIILALALPFSLALRSALAEPSSRVEEPRVVKAAELLPPSMLRGAGYRVAQWVPTNGVMGAYTIVADADVFHQFAGTYQVQSIELLRIREEEIPAIVKLNEISKSKVFAQSLGASAIRPVKAAGNMIMNPLDTMNGLPSGVGRLFDRVGSGAGRLWSAATDTSKSGGKRTEAVATKSAQVTRDALGYEQERRQLAKELHVDPYTTNPILSKQLDEVAWTSFSARLGVNTAISIAVPGSLIITGVRAADDLVWDTPRGDLIVWVEDHAAKLNLSKEQVDAFTHNPAIPLSLQVATIENLERLGNVPERADVIALMSGALTEYQARFIASSLRMLAEYNEREAHITNIAAIGPLVGRDQNGTLILPAPADYVSWTPRVAAFGTNPELLAVPHRVLWIAGKMSPLAKEQFVANGWTIQEGPTP